MHQISKKSVTSLKCLRRKLPINPCLIICINNTHFQQQKETDQQIIKRETQQTGKVFFLNKTSMGYDQIELIHDSLDIISSINNVIISSSHPNASKIRKKTNTGRGGYYQACIRSPRWKGCDITEMPQTQITHKTCASSSAPTMILQDTAAERECNTNF